MNNQEIAKLTTEFQGIQKILIALGDENRQHLILEMMQMGNCQGVRVGEITKKTHLSRPAVSHHLQILKDAGIVSRRKEGTKNYYYFGDKNNSMASLITTLSHAKKIMAQLPNQESDED